MFFMSVRPIRFQFVKELSFQRKRKLTRDTCIANKIACLNYNCVLKKKGNLIPHDIVI